MVSFLIRLVGERFARKIERGSPLGAAVGALVGVTAAVGAVVALNAAELLDTYRNAMFLVLGIPLAIVGALVGARLRPTRALLDGTRGLRLTNYNRAAAPLVIAVARLAAAAAVPFLPEDKGSRRPAGQPKEPPKLADRLLLYGALPAMGVGAAVWAWTMVWWVELGPVIVVRRLLRSAQYQRRLLRDWSFAVNGRGHVQHPFDGDGELLLVFEGDDRVTIPVDGKLSAAVVRVLAG